MYFKVETTYDKETLTGFQLLTDRTIRAKRTRAKRIIALIMAVLSFCLGLVWILGFQKAVPGIAAFVMCAAFALVTIFFQKYSTMGIKHDVRNDVHTIIYTFTDKGYASEDSKGVHHNTYDIVKKVCEDDRFYALMIGRTQGFVLDKAHFLEGDPSAFAAFIEEHTKLKIMRPENFARSV